jgi:hypothetical protein
MGEDERVEIGRNEIEIIKQNDKKQINDTLILGIQKCDKNRSP